MPHLLKSCCVVAAAMCSGCGGGTSVEPGAPPTYGFVPDLRGTTVMVFPVQLVEDAVRRTEVDRALRFAVEEAGVDWLLPEDLEDVLARSPGVEVELRNLPVANFLQREVRRVGEPLFAYLIRLNALTGAGVAVIPIAAAATVADSSGDAQWTITAALIDARGGRVAWYGAVDGERGPDGSPLPVASAAAALMAKFVPSGSRGSGARQRH